MDECELIETIQQIQSCIARALPYQFNKQALSALSPEETRCLIHAVDILSEQDSDPQEASNALAYVSFFSRIALEYEHINDLSYLYMTENVLESGVDQNGEIVIWEKNNPNKLYSTNIKFS